MSEIHGGNNSLEQDDGPLHLTLGVANIVTIVVGTVGNMLTILVFSHPMMRRKRVSLYFLTLAIANLASLYIHVIPNVIYEIAGIKVDEMSTFTCKFRRFVEYTSGDITVWILVMLILDRTLTVYRPYGSQNSSNRKPVICSVLMVFIGSVLVNGHLLAGKALIMDGLTKVCAYEGSHQYLIFVNEVWFWIDVCKYSAIQSCVIISCNVALIWKLRESKLALKYFVGNENGRRCSTVNPTSSTTLMMIATGLQFLVTTIPVVLFIAVTDGSLFHGMTFGLLQLLNNSNNALSFFTYCLSGRTFRRELVQLFKTRRTDAQA